MNPQKIKTIKKKFPDEWLLIAVDKVDESTTTPVSGRLLGHSPKRHEIYRKLLAVNKKIKGSILVEYSKDTMPKGFVAAF